MNERSFRHRRQRNDGRLPLRLPAEPKIRAAHTAALTAEEKEEIIATLCGEQFCGMAPAQVYTTLHACRTYSSRTHTSSPSSSNSTLKPMSSQCLATTKEASGWYQALPFT